MTKWIEGSLSDLIDINPPVKTKKGDVYPFISMDVLEPYYKPVEAVEIREFKSGGSRFQNGDTLFARITPCLENGKTAQVKNLKGNIGFGSTEFLVLRGKEGLTDNEFVYYLFIEKKMRTIAKQLMVGTSGRQRVDKKQFENIRIKVPDLPTQKKISLILGDIDKKIEISRKMNKTLEQMAMTIYKSWFINFEPFQNARFVDSELGLVPEGWEVKKLKDIANILMGQSPKSEFYNQIGEGLPFHQGVTNFGNRFPTNETYSSKLIRVAGEGDFLISVRAPVGRINIAHTNMVIGRGLSAISSKYNSPSFLLYTLKVIFSEEDRYGSGTIFNSINKGEMENLKVLVPEQKLINEFEIKISNFDDLIKRNHEQILLLTDTRDYLLPRLLSGEIDVSEAAERAREVISNE